MRYIGDQYFHKLFSSIITKVYFLTYNLLTISYKLWYYYFNYHQSLSLSNLQVELLLLFISFFCLSFFSSFHVDSPQLLCRRFFLLLHLLSSFFLQIIHCWEKKSFQNCVISPLYYVSPISLSYGNLVSK